VVDGREPNIMSSQDAASEREELQRQYAAMKARRGASQARTESPSRSYVSTSPARNQASVMPVPPLTPPHRWNSYPDDETCKH